MTNQVIQTMGAHRSIRKFTSQGISEEQMELLTDTARWAPSSHHVQAYSIIVIRDQKKKETLKTLTGGQQWVADCPVFLVICADYHRIGEATKRHDQSLEIGGAEQLLVGAVDAALVAQNLLTAAESIGLGGVMIGGIRNNPVEVASLLKLPKGTFPVMGMCLGYPDQEIEQKPRLPKQASVFNEEYEEESINQALTDYNETMQSYYGSRGTNTKQQTWSEQMANYMGKPNRPHMNDFLKKQGFLTDL